jgi:hypothetical protein
MFWAKPAREKDKTGSRSRDGVVAVIVLDLAVLIELAVAMYRASSHTPDFTGVFLRTFFGLLIPTLLLWRCGLRKILSQQSEREGGGVSVVEGERL